MSSLQHRGGDRWRVRVYLADGRQVSRSFRANGERAAKRQQARIETELVAEAERHKEYSATLAALVDEWLELKERDCSPSTMIAYRRHAASIKKRLGKIPAADLDGRTIDAWYNEMVAAGQNAANVQAHHRTLRAILTFGFEDRDLPRIATRQAHPPSHQAPEVKPPTAAAVAAILANLPTDREWARAVKLLVYTGLRRGEVVGLRWDGWDGDELAVMHSIVERKGAGVVVRTTKGKRSRVVPLTPAAIEVLDQQQRWQRRHGIVSPWVFPDLFTDGDGGTPRRPGWVSLMWGRHRDEYGARSIGLHALRHHFATYLLEDGVPIHTVQQLLGHAQASTTINIYGHGTDAGRAAALERLKALGSGETPGT